MVAVRYILERIYYFNRMFWDAGDVLLHIIYRIREGRMFVENCSNLYLLSTVACKLAECLTEVEIAELAADLATIGCMLSSILTRRAAMAALCGSGSTGMNQSANSGISQEIESSIPHFVEPVI